MRLEERLERKEYEAVVKAIMRFRRKKHWTYRDESRLCEALEDVGVTAEEALEIVDVELQRKEDGL